MPLKRPVPADRPVNMTTPEELLSAVGAIVITSGQEIDMIEGGVRTIDSPERAGN
jgi:hypothetical protein